MPYKFCIIVILPAMVKIKGLLSLSHVAGYKKSLFNALIIGAHYAKMPGQSKMPALHCKAIIGVQYRKCPWPVQVLLPSAERKVSSSETQAKPFLWTLIKYISCVSSEALLYRWTESLLPGEARLALVLSCLVHLVRKEAAGHHFEGKRNLVLRDKMLSYSGLVLYVF